MSNEVATFLMPPRSLSESMELCKMIAQSNFCPTSMRGKPGDVILALQMGSEVGLSPMQAIQNIAVINGKPCLYGDGALAVCLASKAYECHNEWETGSIAEGTLTAHCMVKRKSSEEYTKSFSMEDAKRANLWGKAGPWTQYPSRMLQMRARTFAIRDKFADALRGIAIAEEVSDYEIKKVKVVQNGPAPKPIIVAPQIAHEADVLDRIIDPPVPTPEEVTDHLYMIDQCTTLADLETQFKESYKIFKGFQNLQETIIFAKDNKKTELLEREAIQQE